jgi:hypothetical protein
MGLDATVYCRCFEQGRLGNPPLPEWGVGVSEEGFRTPSTDDLELEAAFDAWNQHACEHEDGVAMHHWLGNIARIDHLRETLEAHASRLPVVTGKVISNGIHSGDWLSPADVDHLAQEVAVLAGLEFSDRRTEDVVRDFEVKLRELIACARRFSRPIVF